MKTFNYIISYLLLIVALTFIGYGFYALYTHGLSLEVVILLAIYGGNLVTTAFIVVQHRHANAKIAWLFVIALMPVVGHIIFVIFGQRYKYRISYSEYEKVNNFDKEEKDIKNDIKGDHKDLFEQQTVMSHRGIYKGEMQLFRQGNDAFDSLFKDLESAKEFIHMHYYIIKPGEIYEQLKSILIRKAKEGVEIRFIIDDFGRWAMPWYEIKELKKYGIQIAIYGKVRFPFIGSANGYRTHRKQVIIDGKIAHMGGINIGDEYANLSKKYGVWVDFQARVTGKAVKSHNLLFIQDWLNVTSNQLDYKKYDPKLKNEGNSNSILVEDGPRNMVPVMQAAICKMIMSAKKEIHITTPYLIPTPEVFSSLRTAALSGVKVNLYIPGKADKKTVLVASRYYATLLQEYGVNIYEANGMLIHSKVGLFDNKYAYFGTANLDTRSLHAQHEVISMVEGKIIKDFIDLIDYYKTLCRKLEINEYKSKRFFKVLQRLFINTFSPIM